MKQHLFKYLIEFLVVVSGIIISLNIEKNNAANHKRDLKNQSLRRLVANIKQDISDSKINETIYSEAIKSANYILNNSNYLFQNQKDSLGYYLDVISKASTIFVDNQEEYLTLRNSGFLELIDDDNLVIAIQKKYSYHSFYKRAESYIGYLNKQIYSISFNKTDYQGLGRSSTYGQYSTYIDENNLTNKELSLIRRKTEISAVYLTYIKQSIVSDSYLIQLIEAEISNN